MPEYIERDTLMRRIKEIHCAECDSYHGIRCRACWVDDTLDYIDSEPAADVAPVVHGRWMDNEDYMFCSCCGMQWNYCDNDTEDFHYCPNCGAIMDGGQNNER